MNEHTADVGRGITLAYEQMGDPAGTPLVLIAGLGVQMISWDDELCQLFVERGYHVTRFDNRDIGGSTHMAFRPAKPSAMLRQRWPAGQYDLNDMADDTAGLLDALGIASANLVGVSMGGMIAQMTAARYPDRVRTLTSIMSTTGARRTGRPALSTWRLMLSRPARNRIEATDRGVRMFSHIGSAGFPFDERFVRDVAGRSWDRDPFPAAGVARQLSAVIKSGDRTPALRSIHAPTLVIHGDRDLMVNPTGGAATAAAIPGARLNTIRGMGHDLPRGAWPALVDLIDNHVRTASLRSTDAS